MQLFRVTSNHPRSFMFCKMDGESIFFNYIGYSVVLDENDMSKFFREYPDGYAEFEAI